MAKNDKPAASDLDGWTPAPGFVLCRPVKREELQGGNKTGLMMPDKVGKVSDNVGVGEVVLCGPPALDIDASHIETQAERAKFFDKHTHGVGLGDLVAFMPYTDAIIEINIKKYTLVPYDKIRAIRRAK